MDDDAEIIAEFLVESHENLDQLDRDLVELEQHPGSRELLSSIFRTIHTIKGTSGFLAFNRLESLTHVGENLLSRLRDGKMTMTTVTAGALLSMVDTVRALLEAIEHGNGDADPSVDVESVVALLERVLSGEAEEAPVAQTEEPAAEPVVETEPEIESEPASEPVVEAETTVELPQGAKAPLKSGKAPKGYEIKGNADSGKYHAPGGQWYDATEAEFWFKSAEDAEAAGFVEAGSQESIEETHAKEDDQ